MPSANGRAVNFYRTSYEDAMVQVERERGHMFTAIRRAWGSPPVEIAAARIGACAHDSGKTFDEVLFWIYEQLCWHGSGSIVEWMEKPLILKA
ncbi:MAG: hypothetical protein DMF64_19040 [Acidobacteria bacterium]|nr:MAG: hypothetical protein DMF64_19040 [Acidobacteriota bacterium]